MDVTLLGLYLIWVWVWRGTLGGEEKGAPRFSKTSDGELVRINIISWIFKGEYYLVSIIITTVLSLAPCTGIYYSCNSRHILQRP